MFFLEYRSLLSVLHLRRTSTGSEPFSLLISLDATIFLLPSVFIVIETICPKICSKTRLKSAKSSLPVDVRRSKTSLLKLPNNHVKAVENDETFVMKEARIRIYRNDYNK